MKCSKMYVTGFSHEEAFIFYLKCPKSTCPKSTCPKPQAFLKRSFLPLIIFRVTSFQTRKGPKFKTFDLKAFQTQILILSQNKITCYFWHFMVPLWVQNHSSGLTESLETVLDTNSVSINSPLFKHFWTK